MRKFAVLFLLAFLFACSSKPAEKAIAVKSPEQLASEDKRFEECRAKLKKAQELGVLYDIKKEDGEVLIVVGPTFYSLPFHAKEGFAETVNGFLMVGEQGKHLQYDLRDYRTNKVVAAYRWGKLEMK